ncbi:MAG: hypothetical protein ACK5M1_09600 [Xanthomarina gelatinilytica]|uniref:hypothetical protein n=1 Tax=Xanthomarina gelatinilytica TaxID=1137281 RepID=UPI003A8C586F
MNKFLVFILTLSVNFTFAQSASIRVGNASNDYLNPQITSSTGIWVTNYSQPTSLKGSPYLFETWNSNNAIFYLKNDKSYGIKNVNYNVQLERFEAKFSEDSILAFNPKNIDKIVVKGRTFKRYLDPEFQRNSFFEELAATKSISILRKYEIEIVLGNINPITHKKISENQMIQKEKYYYTIDGDVLKETKLKKSSILKTLDSDKRDPLKRYANDNNLSFKDANDLKKILEYYNTL